MPKLNEKEATRVALGHKGDLQPCRLYRFLFFVVYFKPQGGGTAWIATIVVNQVIGLANHAGTFYS